MLRRCARQWLRAAKQSQYARGPGQGRGQGPAPALAQQLPRQSSASRVAMQVQQQHLAAQEAEQRLMAFCAATDRGNTDVAGGQLQEAESASKTWQVQRTKTAQPQVSLRNLVNTDANVVYCASLVQISCARI